MTTFKKKTANEAFFSTGTIMYYYMFKDAYTEIHINTYTHGTCTHLKMLSVLYIRIREIKTHMHDNTSSASA